jgi:hypothetical protein
MLAVVGERPDAALKKL